MSFVGTYPFGTSGEPETDLTKADTDGNTVVQGYGPGYSLLLTTDGPFQRRSILDSVPRVRTVSNDPPSTSVVPPEPFASNGAAYVGYGTGPSSSLNRVVSQNIAAGKTVVVYVGADDPSRTLTVTDSKGNTWHQIQLSSAAGYVGIWWAHITVPLVNAVDTINFVWSASTDWLTRGEVFSGLTATSLGNATNSASSALTYSLVQSASAPGEAFVVFEHMFDFSFSDFAIAGWTGAEMNDGTPDQSIHYYWRQVNAGSVVASKTLGVPADYMAAGVVLAYQ